MGDGSLPAARQHFLKFMPLPQGRGSLLPTLESRVAGHPREPFLVLGYKSRNAVSNVEVGIEGLSAKRASAWADVLEVPRDAFFRFVTGETERMEVSKAPGQHEAFDRLTAAERALIAAYRKLPPKYQRRLREQAVELQLLPRAAKRR